MDERPLNGRTGVADWRLNPGFLAESPADFESIHTLLGYFLADHHSPYPLPEKPLFCPDQRFEWGLAAPLEKVIRGQDDLTLLMTRPLFFRNSIAVIEPWQHVGINEWGESVRASKNIAYLGQKIADADTILFPFWSMADQVSVSDLVATINAGLAIIVEGGHPSVYDPLSFSHPHCSRDSLFDLIEQLLLARSPHSAPSIFICLGHQLAAAGHIRLLQKAVRDVLKTELLARDYNGQALRVLRTICHQIARRGESLAVRKNGRLVASDWHHSKFSVAQNIVPEVGIKQIQGYRTPDSDTSHVPFELIHAHDVMADQHEGVIDTMLAYERDIHIAMFHQDEVNEEAILFANWAYRLLHDAVMPYRSTIAGSPLAWLMRLPYAVEILCSTTIDDQLFTRVSATCINYKDFETNTIRRSFTTQFHPELLADLREFGKRSEISYAELKKDDGIRMFARLLYHGMQE